MPNISKIVLVSLSFLLMSCSQAGIMDSIYRGPTLKITLYQEHMEPEISKIEGGGDLYIEPQIIIEAITPVTCTNTPDGKFWGECALDKDQPLPEQIEFRYGVWISQQEADKRFPPIPKEAYAEEPNNRDYEDIDEWLALRDAFREKVYNQPQYQKIREAKQAAMEQEIDWHTYTIYPKQFMQKYYDKMNFFNRMQSSRVYYRLTFNYDMSVTETDRIIYGDPAKPLWWPEPLWPFK